MKLTAPLCLLLTTLAAFGGIIEFAGDGVEIKTREASFTEEKVNGEDVVKARFEPTEKWSFVRFVPSAGSWDLSKYSGVEVQITNAGSTSVKPGVRVDEVGEPGKQPWNSANAQEIAPGDTKTILVQFGKDYNKPKEIDKTKIGAVHIFFGKGRAEPSTLIISNIKAVE